MLTHFTLSFRKSEECKQFVEGKPLHSNSYPKMKYNHWDTKINHKYY